MGKFRQTDDSQHVMIPVNMESQIQPGTFEYGMVKVLDRLDLSRLLEKYKNDETGRPAYDPKILLRIILFSYSRGIYSSRRMEQACRENILFMAIAQFEKPDFTTLASFISSMEEEIHGIFENVVLICHEANLIGGEIFAIDGCKVKSNASREWTGKINDLEGKRKKFGKILKCLRKRHRETDSKEERARLKGRIRIKEHEIERLTNYVKNNDPLQGKRGLERKGNITDPESAIMKSSHGSIQGYNGIAVVDGKHQIIVTTEAFGVNQEQETLIPIMNKAQEFHKRLPKGLWKKGAPIFLGDTGYFSEENLKYLDDLGFDYYIPDHQFRRRDERFQSRMKTRKFEGMFRKEHFRYDSKEDSYYCPAKKRLKRIGGIIAYRQGDGKIYSSSQAECTICKVRQQCLSKTARTKKIIQPVNAGKNYSELMRSKIDLVESRETYAMRMGIVEPVFGNITFHKRLNYLTLRGHARVNVQWLLYSIMHNLEKYSYYGIKT